MLTQKLLGKENLPEYQVMTDLKCNVKSFTDMNITIFRSQDFNLRSLEFGLFLKFTF